MNQSRKNNLSLPELLLSDVHHTREFRRFRNRHNWDGKIKLLSIVILFLALTIPGYGNDFYPSNINPAEGMVFRPNNAVPITFDVCLGYDYPASAGEWYVEITILDEESHVLYHETIPGFDANGPQCFPITSAPDFMPPWVGTFTLRIQTFYAQEINSENDLFQSTFIVKELKDLALLDVPYPVPTEPLFSGVWVRFGIQVKNVGDSPFIGSDWGVKLYTDPISPVEIAQGVDISPGQEVLLYSIGYPITDMDIPNTAYTFIIASNSDENASNNSKDIEYTSIGYTPLWLNEFRTSSSLLKTSKTNANGEFVEIITNQNIQNPGLYQVTIYDSTGHQIQTSTLDQFTAGETVDSFTVYTFDFTGDVLPDNYGGIALSYDSLLIKDFFISWGGTITAVDGDWADSSSMDIGIVPQPGSSIALTGNGTDFNDFMWQLSTPSPGTVNFDQSLPVDLVSFSASVEEYRIRLSWTTVTEKNNAGFEIERALDNNSKKLNFEKIGYVPGAGTASEHKEYSFVDNTAPTTKLKYRLRQIDYNGAFEYSNIIEVNLSARLSFNLGQNYPNPFNPVTKIRYAIPRLGGDERGGLVKLIVYDVLGKEVATIVNEEKQPGNYEVDFNASCLSSGVYFYKLQSGSFIQTKKMILLQ